MPTVSPNALHLRERLYNTISPSITAAIDALVASVGSGRVWAVGGVPRDLLLGRTLVDVDLAVEGDAIAATRLAFPGHAIRVHERFGTASLRIDATRIDVAMTRAEAYRRPGALPAVRPAPIDEDLARRDFTVNALAFSLGGPPRVRDPFNGAADIERRIIRTLHAASFRDDATRILRAHRYAARLGFTLDPATHAAARRDAHYVETITGARLRRELELTFSDERGGEAMEALDGSGILRGIQPSLSWRGDCSEELNKAEKRLEVAPLGFALLARDATEADAAATVLRLRLRRDEAASVMAMPRLQRFAPALARSSARPSGVVLVLDRFPIPAVRALSATSSDRVVRAVCLRYLDEWRFIRATLTGDDVQGMGVPRGPRVAQALQLARAARLDGWADTTADETAIVRRFAQSIDEAGRTTAVVDFNEPD